MYFTLNLLTYNQTKNIVKPSIFNRQQKLNYSLREKKNLRPEE